MKRLKRNEDYIERLITLKVIAVRQVYLLYLQHSEHGIILTSARLCGQRQSTVLLSGFRVNENHYIQILIALCGIYEHPFRHCVLSKLSKDDL